MGIELEMKLKSIFFRAVQTLQIIIIIINIIRPPFLSTIIFPFKIFLECSTIFHALDVREREELTRKRNVENILRNSRKVFKPRVGK